MKRNTLVFVLGSIVIISAFHFGESPLNQTPNLPVTLYNYENIPIDNRVLRRLIRNDNTPANNPITNAGATLGRVLFYDKNLSATNTVSCASCHRQQFGFTEPSRFSAGHNGELTSRNSMNLHNARYYARGHFFWDERAESLEDQVLMPIQSEVEMGMSLDNLVVKLRSLSYYPQLFQDAFGSTTIDTSVIARALAQFVRSMATADSRFYQGSAVTNINQDFPNYTPQENLGKQLFMDTLRANCNSCHRASSFQSDAPRNIGLDIEYDDNGVGALSNIRGQNGRFKSPGLTNVAVTGPYMHDGRFATLNEVIDFYSTEIQPHRNLSRQLRNPDGTPLRPNYTQQEKQALIAFLNTLTEESFLTDRRWSDPFEIPPLAEISSFTAATSESEVNLNWLTLSESNMSLFSVERSSDGNQFGEMASVPATLESVGQSIYSYTDVAPLEGNNFYRLKCIGLSGEVIFSNTQVVSFASPLEVNLFPNPVGDAGATLEIQSAQKKTVVISIYRGRRLMERLDATLTIGHNVVQLPFSNYRRGTYVVQIDEGNRLTAIHVVKA